MVSDGSKKEGIKPVATTNGDYQIEPAADIRACGSGEECPASRLLPVSTRVLS